MKKIVIGSPVHQKNNILKEFLESLEKLDLKNYDVTYYFIDDNKQEESSKLLNDFSLKHKNTIIKKGEEIHKNKDSYVCTSDKHHWKKKIIEKVALFKNEIINYSKQQNVDYLFFIDSDLLLNPLTIKHLISRNVDIVSNVFWTQWVKGGNIFPQVWQQDFNSFYKVDWDREYTKQEKIQIEFDFINRLKVPGIYKVGGLGACTLLSKKAINSGVNFSTIDNVSFWGEDRHFCIRAAVLGLDLYVDTVYPAFHIYREELLENVENFKKNGFNPEDIMIRYSFTKRLLNKIKGMKFFSKFSINNFKKIIKHFLSVYYKRKRIVSENKKVVLSMVVKNESKNYLEMVLKDVKEYVDEVLIIDDASEDNTVEICEKVLKDFPHKIIKNEFSLFHTEYKLRMKQWRETLKLNPGWILFLDADEVFENKMKTSIKYLIENSEVDLYCFPWYDMWDEKHYRSDELWQGHNNYMPVLLRYQPKFKYKFRKTNQHCGRLPKNVYYLNYVNSNIRIKHYGWSREADRLRKYDRYMKLDSDGKYGNKLQYESILDKNPNLVEFIDED